jgi:hypothetical protein
MSVKTFWQSVRQMEATLRNKYPDGCLFIQPVENWEKNSSGGDALQAPVAVAAQCLVKGTHREATDEEIERYHRHGSQNLMRMDAQELRNGGLTKVVLSSARVPREIGPQTAPIAAYPLLFPSQGN